MQFKAETDLDINGETISSYVNWLEKLSIEEINKDILSENENLKNVIQNAMDILDDGISSR